MFLFCSFRHAESRTGLPAPEPSQFIQTGKKMEWASHNGEDAHLSFVPNEMRDVAKKRPAFAITFREPAAADVARRNSIAPDYKTFARRFSWASIRLRAEHLHGPSMRQDQPDIWNPFGERVDNLSATERADIERAQAWACYANGGGGDPSYFDYMTWIMMRERSR